MLKWGGVLLQLYLTFGQLGIRRLIKPGGTVLYTTGEEGGRREGGKEEGGRREGEEGKEGGRLHPIGLGLDYNKCFCSCTSEFLKLQAIICMHGSMRLGNLAMFWPMGFEKACSYCVTCWNCSSCCFSGLHFSEGLSVWGVRGWRCEGVWVVRGWRCEGVWVVRSGWRSVGKWVKSEGVCVWSEGQGASWGNV